MKKQPSYKKLLERWNRDQMLKLYQAELIKLLDYLKDTNKRLVIVVEGRDTAGKGGFIKRFLKYLNPKHAKAVALPKPSDIENGQIYFQRYIKHLPVGGEILLFDRSWYNRAMVERVLGFCTDEEHDLFMKNVSNFEDMITYDGNTIFVKLYFSISKDTQEKRLEARVANPTKAWKFSTADMQALDKYDDYTGSKYHMFKKTCTEKHPWIVVRGDKKYSARLNAIKHILSLVDYTGKSKELDLSIPDGQVLTGTQEVSLMKQQKKHLGRFEE